MNDEVAKPPLSEPFTRMAAAIDHNTASKFGGAVVIIPPGEGSVPIEILMLDSGASAALFWSNMKTIVQMALDGVQIEERRQQGFGSR